MSIARSSPNGGAEHGIFVLGFQKRPTGPPHGLRRTQVGGPPPRAVPWTIFATWPRFITLVNARPSVGSDESPFQLPPPTVLGNVSIVPSTPGGVYGPFVYIAFASQSSLQNAACSGVSV